MAMLPDFETLPQLLSQRVQHTPTATAFFEKDPSGRWQATRWDEFDQAVQRLAGQLCAIGLRSGDRLALWMPNGVLWETIQHAAYRVGAVVVGLDLNDPADRIEEILRLCPPAVVFVDREERLQKISPKANQVFKTVITRRAEEPSTYDLGNSRRFCDELPEPAAVPPLSTVDPQTLATIIFTSGTTGRPKALSYKHSQIALAIQSIAPFFCDLPDQAHTACWLPLANPFQRMINYCAMAMNWQAFMVPAPATIMAQVAQIAPHLFAAVPRFYEKLWDGIRQKMDGLPPRTRALSHWALNIARQYHREAMMEAKPSWPLRLKQFVAERLVLAKIRAVMGPNLRYLLSGSAAMPKHLLEAFGALGWTLLEAYGISENIVPMAMNAPGAIKPGSVGRPLAPNTVRIAEDGEILVKGAGVAEDAALTPDGFLNTGDTGRLDADGFLWLTGRKCDMFKLSTGRKIIPSAIEEAIVQIESVEHCIAIGGNRKFVTALLNIPADRWEALCRQHNGSDGATGYLRNEIQRQCHHLPDYCRPVEFAVAHETFTPQAGELTANLKLRRAFVLQKYAAIIETLYQKMEN